MLCRSVGRKSATAPMMRAHLDDALRRNAAILSCGDTFDVMGGKYDKRASKAGLRPVLAELDLLVVPSLWEASSVVSMEAMAAGVPVLGTDCIGLREVLRGTPSRVVRAGDPAALDL